MRFSLTNKGFTLIEVLISVFILALIGFTTSKAVVDAASLKEILKGETEFSSEVRTSISFMERDLSQVFNPRWFLPPQQLPIDPYAQPVQRTTNPNTPGGTTAGPTPVPALPPEELNRYLQGMAFQQFEYWGAVYDSTGIRPSRFKGTETSVQFISTSHFRIYAQKKESIYAKVKYELVRQPPNPNLTKTENEKLAGLYQLVKIENTRAFDLEEKRDSPSENVYVILSNIKKLRFGYYKPETKDPLRDWDSEREENRGQFPQAVEMEFSLAAPNDRTLDATVLFKLEAPNYVLPATY